MLIHGLITRKIVEGNTFGLIVDYYSPTAVNFDVHNMYICFL